MPTKPPGASFSLTVLEKLIISLESWNRVERVERLFLPSFPSSSSPGPSFLLFGSTRNEDWYHPFWVWTVTEKVRRVRECEGMREAHRCLEYTRPWAYSTNPSLSLSLSLSVSRSLEGQEWREWGKRGARVRGWKKRLESSSSSSSSSSIRS